MERAWPFARALLQTVADDGGRATWSPWDSADWQTLDDFAGRYGEHIRLEEEIVYPAARSMLDAQALSTMGEDMQGRRIQRTDR